MRSVHVVGSFFDQRLEQRRPGRDVVGVVGGLRSAGVAVLTGYSNDFADPNKCEAIASQIARVAHLGTSGRRRGEPGDQGCDG